MNYATFWQRFGAMWIDFLVLLPVILLQGWLESFSKVMAVILVIPMAAVYCAYIIFCHGRFGQTVGKHVMGIRVVRTTGERIGWREAWLRSTFEVLVSVFGVVASFIALASIADTDYYGVGWWQRAQNLQGHTPAWFGWTDIALDFWMWSEVVIMLTNRRRRALHDFIAGTVVVSERGVRDAQVHAT